MSDRTEYLTRSMAQAHRMAPRRHAQPGCGWLVHPGVRGAEIER